MRPALSALHVQRLPEAALLAARAWVALAQVDVHLRRVGFQASLAAACSGATASDGAADPRQQAACVARARRYAAAIERAARCYPRRADCLQQSLVLHQWMQREGVPTTLQLGVLRGHNGSSAFRAHAWVELNGRVLNDRAAAVRVFARLMAPELPNYLLGAGR